jgi:acyl-coenzyme A synthetase/AMP-(fatty) acid ligase
MKDIDFLLNVFKENSTLQAVVWRDRVWSYRMLLNRVAHWRNYLNAEGVTDGTVAAIEGDFSPNSICLLLALIERRCIVVPLTSSVSAKKAEFLQIAQVDLCLTLDDQDQLQLVRMPSRPKHELLQRLALDGHPGLILFSSGSTGKSKAAVHDLVPILQKCSVKRRPLSGIAFLLLDHIGGFNTMLYQLSNGGCIVTVQERTVESVLRAIDKYKVELLPTSPTFINQVLLSEACHNYDLSSLKLVTYGTEPMPESTLKRFHALFPNVQLQQTYGLSELGILRSQSLSSESLWVKVGAASAMLGYLNSPVKKARNYRS